MRYGLAEISGSPAPEPVLTLAEAKTHLRVDITADDTLIQALILAAARHAEADKQAELTPVLSSTSHIHWLMLRRGTP